MSRIKNSQVKNFLNISMAWFLNIKNKYTEKNEQTFLEEALKRGLNGPVPRTELNWDEVFLTESKDSNLFYTFEIPFMERGTRIYTPPPVLDDLPSPPSRYLAQLNANVRKKQVNKILNQLSNDIGSNCTFYDDKCIEIINSITKNWPVLVAEGSELIPSLIMVAEKNHYLASRILVSQLIGDIARHTNTRLNDQVSPLLCDRCLKRYLSHDINLSWLEAKVIYYGCRACSSSKEFIKHRGKVVAVLDSRLKQKYSLSGDTLRVNWLSYQQIFDFDEVEFVRTTDESAERFVVQVGNDTDSIHSNRYKNMPCIIEVDCRLSENTIRVVKKLFENTEIKAITEK